jgi:hypothetical protein
MHLDLKKQSYILPFNRLSSMMRRSQISRRHNSSCSFVSINTVHVTHLITLPSYTINHISCDFPLRSALGVTLFPIYINGNLVNETVNGTYSLIAPNSWLEIATLDSSRTNFSDAFCFWSCGYYTENLRYPAQDGSSTYHPALTWAST